MTLQALKEEVLADGKIDDAEVEKIAAVIYDPAGEDGAGVSKNEADLMFDINDAVTGKDNSPGWKPLFVEAVTKHVLEDAATPGVVDVDECNYLIDRIGRDGIVDKTEMALLINVVSHAQSVPDALNEYILDSLKAAVLEDGVISAEECTQISTVIYGTGSLDGVGVSREEADFMFEINNAVSGKSNAPEWTDLFVEAVCKHVLEDETSPGVVDEEESDWLIAKVQEDNVYDSNEIALFKAIKEKATSVHEKLTFQFELMGV